jgi:hypothetical protein
MREEAPSPVSLAAFALALIALVGCATVRTDDIETRRNLHQFKKTTTEVLSTAADGAVSVVPLVTIEETWEDEGTKTTAKSNINTAPDYQKIGEGIRNVSQAGMSMGSGTGPLAVVVGLAVSAAGLVMRNMGTIKGLKDSLTKTEADRDEGWSKAEQHQARAEQYARELPPTTYVPNSSQPRV